MGKTKSLRSKAVHFVSDLTTVLLNPISDKPSKPPAEDQIDTGKSQVESATEEDTGNSVDGPDTSSFTAFLYSLLSSSEAGDNSSKGSDEKNDNAAEMVSQPSDNVRKESSAKKGFLSRGRQSLRTIYQAARIGGNRGQERKGDSDMRTTDECDTSDGLQLKHMKNPKEQADLADAPAASEPSLLLSDKARSTLYASLPALVQGRKWLLLYSTWRHGISLSTLYRRSMLWPGLSLLVVGDKKGAVFGGLVEAPLRPTNKRYQGTNNSFVFTNIPGRPLIYRPTGANRYFTLCSPDFLAIGGGGHFALYLDNDLLNGSSSVSETYGNPCLAYSEDFQIKEVELWGFVHGSKYEELLASSRMEAPGICRW